MGLELKAFSARAGIDGTQVERRILVNMPSPTGDGTVHEQSFFAMMIPLGRAAIDALAMSAERASVDEQIEAVDRVVLDHVVAWRDVVDEHDAPLTFSRAALAEVCEYMPVLSAIFRELVDVSGVPDLATGGLGAIH